MTARVPDAYFDRMYAASADPWQLQGRWYEQRKYAITMALLPHPTYQEAFEPGCSVGVLTQMLTDRCGHVTATDVAEAALYFAGDRSRYVTGTVLPIDGGTVAGKVITRK